MASAIDYEKVMAEIVYINLPGPGEPTDRMSGSQMLHGFLCDLYKATDAAVKQYVNELCLKWNVHYRQAPK
ncbi:MAG: hypothetical protein PHQ43_07195 [Dehalococcoidales bacterium]|nr:hypothetical protein [Dehalococcoidales bacterium]